MFPIVVSHNADPAHDAFIGNFVLIGAIAVGASAWMLYYTDWFPEVGGLLALGGIFSWFAFVSRIVPDHRFKAMQDAMDRLLFNNSRARVPLFAVLMLLVVAANFVGAIDLASAQGVDRLVWIDKLPTATELPERLASGSSERTPFLTTWWNRRDVSVKVSGYPALTTRLLPWTRATLRVPSSFLLKPVVLLRPTADLVNNLSSDSRIQLTHNGSVKNPEPVDGHTIWIGCDEDVEVPERVLEEWRADAASLQLWKYPRALSGDVLTLHAKDTITVKILNRDGSAYTSRSIVVRRVDRSDQFPQVEDLDVPHG